MTRSTRNLKLQRELFDVLLRLRRLPIAIVCDIEMMYLRIGIADCDKPYHRFLWREMDQSRSPDVYEFDRVVFGVNWSPFQAQFVLRHHAQEFQRKFPKAAETILKSTYMDDSMDSVLNEEQGVRLYQELSSLLTHAGMHARKWLSNSQEVLHEVPIKDRKSEVDLDTEQLPSAKTLGVWWSADHDTLTFRENAPGNDMRYTKRNFLKKIASLFDPLGLLAPFTVRAKMLLQDMWTAGLDWDEEMSESLTKEAQDWFRELPYLKGLQIPRCLQEKTKTVNAIALHTFVDASENAYGAVVYARYSYEDGSLSSNIVAAKTRVAPTIATSIPRLELLGAVVGVRMAKRISATLDIPMNTSVFWSYSVNVIWWARGRSRQFKPFVANRVGEIQSISDPAQWRYVPTSINPADFLSRGMKAKDLKKCDVWWKGPEYLLQPEIAWPSNRTVNGPIENAELKLGSKLKTPKEIPMTTNHTESQRYEPTFQAFVTTFDSDVQPTIDPRRYSSWLKLRRITAWMMRFVSNCQRKKEERIAGELTEGELKVADIQLIKEAQREEFTEEYKALTGRRSIPSRNKLVRSDVDARLLGYWKLLPLPFMIRSYAQKYHLLRTQLIVLFQSEADLHKVK